MKKVYLSCHLCFHYFPLQTFISVHCENKFREVLDKDPVMKISSTEFAVSEPAKPEHLFRENFCLQGNKKLQPE